MSNYKKTMIISVDYLKKNTTLSLNISDELIESSIYDAQMIHIQQMLGNTLYNDILTKLHTGETLNTYYDTLVEDYVVPTLINFSVYKLIPLLAYKFMQKGVVQQNSENSSIIVKDDIEYLRNIYKDTAEFCQEQGIKYIKDNLEQFSVYNSGDDCTLEGLDSGYNCPICLDEDYIDYYLKEREKYVKNKKNV